MKHFLTLLFFSSLSFAAFDTLKSYYTHFTQTVIDPEANVITYTGTFSAKRPHFALWEYQKPAKKSVYIIDKEVTVVEPELEQAIKRYAKESFTLFNILEDATKVDSHTYTKQVDQTLYILKVEGDTIIKLYYEDSFENNVTIVFHDTVANKPLSIQNFHPIIPEDFDIISE